MPSCVTTAGGGHSATPDNASVQVNVIVTSVLCQPVGSAEGVTCAVMLGGVRSTVYVFISNALGVQPCRNARAISVVVPSPRAIGEL